VKVEEAKMLLLKGRPESAGERLEKEIRVYDLLDELKVDYSRVDHEPAMTMEACLEIDKTLGAPTCKNLLLCNRQMTDFYLLLIPGDKVFKTKDLSAQLGVSRLSFSPGEYMEKFLDITPGSLSVMGLMNDKDMRVRLVIDEDVLKSEYIGFHPCINTTTVRVTVEELCKIIIPKMGHTPTVVNLPREAN
jgi:Ala-tRNA(Pro) deacylase